MSDLEECPACQEAVPAAEPRMDRRTFLLSLSGGAFVVAAGSLLAGCGGGANTSGSNISSGLPGALTLTYAQLLAFANSGQPIKYPTTGTPLALIYVPSNLSSLGVDPASSATIQAFSPSSLPSSVYNGVTLLSNYIFLLSGSIFNVVSTPVPPGPGPAAKKHSARTALVSSSSSGSSSSVGYTLPDGDPFAIALLVNNNSNTGNAQIAVSPDGVAPFSQGLEGYYDAAGSQTNGDFIQAGYLYGSYDDYGPGYYAAVTPTGSSSTSSASSSSTSSASSSSTSNSTA